MSPDFSSTSTQVGQAWSRHFGTTSDRGQQSACDGDDPQEGGGRGTAHCMVDEAKGRSYEKLPRIMDGVRTMRCHSLCPRDSPDCCTLLTPVPAWFRFGLMCFFRSFVNRDGPKHLWHFNALSKTLKARARVRRGQRRERANLATPGEKVGTMEGGCGLRRGPHKVEVSPRDAIATHLVPGLSM